MTAEKLHPCFAEDADGNIFVCRGDQPVKRWNGIAAAFVDAGLDAPTNTITVGSSGTGDIVGSYFAYQRVVDADGRVSNLSPISTEYETNTVTKTITNATNATPIVITTSTTHGLSTGNRVKVYGVVGNRGANGIWDVTVLTTTTFSLTSPTGGVSSGTAAYLGGGTMIAGVSSITYSNLGAISDSRVAKRQILRNTDGQASVFYVDVELTNLSTTSTSSTNTDEDLLGNEEVALFDVDGTDLNRSVHWEPPDYKQVMVAHYSRMFWLVDGYHNHGAVVLTNGSSTVTGIDTTFTSSMVGWRFYPSISSNTTEYTITAVNTSAQTLTLDANWGGSSDPYALYEVRPAPGEKYTVYFSGAGYPDSARLGEGLQITNDLLSGDMTGAMPMGPNLYILFQNRMYTLNYLNKPNDGEASLRRWRGCINQRCWAIAENTAYLMDSQGIYTFSDEGYQPISIPIRPLFQRDRGNKYQVNWSRSNTFHCLQSPRSETIKWFVCLGSHRQPHHAICYQYRLRRFWIEEYPVPVMSSCLGNLDSGLQTFLGLSARRVAMGEIGNLDVLSNNEPGTKSGTATSSSQISISDSAAYFDSSVVGSPIQITHGTGYGQMRMIVSATSTKLVIDKPWMIKPDTTSEYQIGGIRWRYSTGKMRFIQTEKPEVRGIEIAFKPTEEPSRISFRRYHDESSSAVASKRTYDTVQGNGVAADIDAYEYRLDTTKATGYVKHDTDSLRAADIDGVRYVRYEIEGVTNGNDEHRIRGIALQGVVGE